MANDFKQITFSIIVPCYNYSKYLEECISSIVTQVYTDYEIIIVNDGSIDNTKEIATNLITKYSDANICLLEQKNTGQPAISRNNGINKSNGKYILCLDADDKISSNYLQEAIDIFKKNKKVSIVFPNLQHFGDDETYVEFSDNDFQLVFTQNCFLVSSIFEKKVWSDSGGYSTNVPGYEDWDFWVNAVSRGYRTKHSKKSILLYRKHGAGMLTIGQDRDLKNKANIVLNNHNVYSNSQIQWAKNIILEVEKIVLKNRIGVMPVFDDFQQQYQENLNIIKQHEKRTNKLDKELNIDQIKRTSIISTPSYDKFIILNDLPLVSVILTTYNRKVHLKRSIKSVLNQKYPNIELIVINDGGNCVKNIINDLGVECRINYLSLGLNHGLAGARNFGLRLAQGDYICFLDDDDYFETDHIYSLFNEIKEKNVNVVYSNSKRIFEKYDGSKFIIQKIEDPDPACAQFHVDKILIYNLMPVNTVMFSRKSFEDTGYFDETLTVHEDWDYWIRLSRKYYFHHLAKTTCAVTVSSNNMTSIQSRDFYYTMKRIHSKYSGNLVLARAQNQMLQSLYHHNNPIKNTPLISIILYSTNTKELKCVQESIYSIINHTKSVCYEIILATNQKIISFQEVLECTDAKIVTIDENKNSSDAINSAANIATGKYLVILKPFASPKLGWVKIMLDSITNKEKIKIVLAETRYLKGYAPIGLKYINNEIEIINDVSKKSHIKQYVTDDCLIYSDLILLKLSDFKKSGGFIRDHNFYLNIYKICSDLRYRDMHVALTKGETCISSYDFSETELILIKKEYSKVFHQIHFLNKIENACIG